MSELRTDDDFEKIQKWLEVLVNENQTLKLILTEAEEVDKEIFFYRGAVDKQLRFKAEYVEAMI